MAFNKLIDMIPGVRDININVRTMQQKFGVFGDPVLLGTAIGIIIGILAGYGFLPGENPSFLTLGVSMGAVMVLIPKMAALLMEGLLPISDAAQTFIQKHFQNRGKIYIGLDSAVGTGHPVTLTMALILVPFCIALSFVLPGNKVMPLADLACIPYMLVLVTPIVHQNGFRGILCGIVVLAVGLYIATDLSPLITRLAQIKHEALGSEDFFRWHADDERDLAVLEREGDWGRAIGVFPLRGGASEVQVDAPDGCYINLIDATPIEVRDGRMETGGSPAIFLV